PAVGREVEVVDGRVVAREGVVRAAERLGAAVDLARTVGARALEHHVLEKMRGAAVPRLLVARAGAVAQRGGHHRGLAVREQADGQAVVQPVQRELSGQARQLVRGTRPESRSARDAAHPPSRSSRTSTLLRSSSAYGFTSTMKSCCR